MPTHHINRFLHRNNRLHPILVRIDRDRHILDKVRDALPDSVRNHCLHATVEDGGLIIFTTSPVWATRLRFLAPDLIRAIPELPSGTGVTVRIAIDPETRQQAQGPQDPNGPRLSAGARQHLLEAADGLQDTKLAAALRQLAGNSPNPAEPEQKRD